MSLIDAYKKKLETQIQEHKAQLDLLKARAKRVAAATKYMGYEELAQADKHLEQIRAKFQKLKGQSGGALGEIKTGVKKALSDLKTCSEKAARHFSPPRPQRAKPVRAKTQTRTKPARPAKKRGR